ncbi:MAG TPA: deoxyribonuclease IV [Gemmatimonadaceae bacterium]|nr:deoxyribonuclease IV [Gemmatimonadaceae bacterium]
MASRRTSNKKASAKKVGPKTAKKPAGKSKLAKKRSPAVASKRSPTPPAKPANKVTKKPAFNAKTDSANDPAWIPPVWDDDVLLGAHVSSAGGTHAAPRRALAIGASAMQLFTKMANRWAERPCETDECSAFTAALSETRVRATIAHDSYLINLASPDDALRRRSIESFVSELQRCNALGLTYLVSHPGNYIDDRASGIQRNADAITEALARASGHTVLCLETTAGSGTAIGASFEDLAALINAVPEPHRSRVSICVDTCHTYSAGYDFANAYDDVWRAFDDLLGLSRLRVMHLNDSKTPFNSRRDRHELIGEGSLGEIPFRRIMNDERLARVPKVIETPKGTDPTATDARMLARLRSYLTVG